MFHQQIETRKIICDVGTKIIRFPSQMLAGFCKMYQVSLEALVSDTISFTLTILTDIMIVWVLLAWANYF